MPKWIIFLLIGLLASCAKTTEEQVRSAIQEAKFELNSSNCSGAKSILDDVGFQEDNADYISVYASSQACVGSYTELDTLFGGNLDNLDSSNLLTSLAAFTSSNETTNDSTSYTALNDAITTLISYDEAAGGSPSTVARTAKFGAKKAGDLSMQTMYLLFVQLGKHFALYGNTNAAGLKGNGSITGNNSCIFSYSTQDAVDFINDAVIGGASVAAPLGTCTNASGTEGSDLLESPETAANIKRRLCQGIVYFNNLLDILGNITLPSSSSLGDVSNINSALTLLMTAAETLETTGQGGIFNDGPAAGQNAIAALRDVTSQTVCEAENLERIEKFYALFFEATLP